MTRLVSGEPEVFEATDKALRPQTLAEFVGQEQIKANLSVFIDAAKGRGEALDLLYVNNEQEWVLEAQVRDGRAGFVRQFLGQVPRSRADAIADYRIMANQPEGEYASSNWEDCSIWRFVG